MSPISKGGGDYVNLLELWQDLQSYKINVIILACKFLIVNKKKYRDLFEGWYSRKLGNRIA